jgi:DNA-directed RNA polymerase specialized sigma24 family protein
LSETLDQLAELDLSLAEVVDLKFFAGFSFDEIAALRGVSSRTVMRHWNQARIFLHNQLKEHALD